MELFAKKLLDKEFTEELIRNLNVLRKSSILCDTILRAEGKDFAAHKCVLTAASPYFRALFTTDFKENESNLVELKEVKCAALSEVLQFMYTGEARADSSNAQDLIMLADYLILPSLRSKVLEFLEVTINSSNCLSLECFASQFNCESLKEAAVTYKVRNFVAVTNSDDFKSLDFEKVKALVSRDDIIVSKEEDVYEAVILWVKHDLSAREGFFPELLKCVRTSFMSKYTLRRILGKEELVVNSPVCTSILLQGLDAFLFPDGIQALMKMPRLCLKHKEPVVILTGGHTVSSSPIADTLGLVLATKKWFNLPVMPCPRTRHAAAVCAGQLYVMGGNSDAPLYYFNPGQNKWFASDESLPASPHSSLVTHNDELYMIGGEEGHWRKVTKYNYKLNKWKELSPMRFPRAAHCVVALDEFIYVMAGHDGNACCKTVECYDPSNDKWSQIPDMNNPRRFAAAATTGEKIIVVCGYCDMNFKNIETSCEMFDKSLNQWSLVSSPIVPRPACGIVSAGNCVYLFGGEDANWEQY
ncbi:hypothetical protein ACROYT_G020557 [Oculina patagonica]